MSNKGAAKARPGRQEGARFALAVLTAINLLNYVDRYVPSSVKDLIKEDMHLTDAQTSWPLTGMILVYMVSSPIFGWVSDHQLIGRRQMLTAAIVFWSAATSIAALANNLGSLVALRSLVGVGEAAYVVIATPLIADLFPPKERNVALGVFYLAIPVGAALGYIAGGVLGQAFGWRTAFLFCGIPGLVVAFLVLLIRDPPRGINDDAHSAEQQAVHKAITHVEAYKRIFSNPYFLFSLAGITANTFALGGFADWMAPFFHRYRHMDIKNAGLIVGAATVVGGIVGLYVGASAADHFKRKGMRNAYWLLPAAFSVPGAGVAWIALNVSNAGGSAFLFMLAEVFVWTYTSPISTININCLDPHLRARGTGALIFVQHILGDVISPPIIGAISDRTGSLLKACQILPAFILLSGMFYLVAGFTLPELPSMMSKGKEGPNDEEEKISFWKVLCAREERTSDGDDDADHGGRGVGGDEEGGEGALTHAHEGSDGGDEDGHILLVPPHSARSNTPPSHSHRNPSAVVD